ncbi:MAG: SRPBCC family protein [Phycisphaerales bacterium]|nr:SRPBCC family protein [Phycisphaerales bacterium]
MATLEVTVSRHINASQQRVWEVITDIAHSDEWISGITNIELLTGNQQGVGMRWKETRVMFGRESTEELEITAFEPPLFYIVEAESCGSHFTTELRCNPIDEETTELVIKVLTEPTTMLGRLMKPLVKLAMKSIRKTLHQDLDDIAAACTTGD